MFSTDGHLPICLDQLLSIVPFPSHVALLDRCLNILVVTDHVRDALSGLQPVVWHVSRLHATYRTGNASRNRPGRRIRWILNEWPPADGLIQAG